MHSFVKDKKYKLGQINRLQLGTKNGFNLFESLDQALCKCHDNQGTPAHIHLQKLKICINLTKSKCYETRYFGITVIFSVFLMEHRERNTENVK